MASTQDEIYEKVRDILVDRLALDEEEVTRDAQLVADLGAESLDILDINFELEKKFGIKIPKGELAPPEDFLGNPDYVDGDRVTPAGVEKLKQIMPHADFSEFESDPSVDKLWNVLTVQTIVNYISGKLEKV